LLSKALTFMRMMYPPVNGYVSALEIKRRNRKLNRIDNYLSQSELREALEEVFGGVLSEDQIDALVDRDALIQQALDMIITSAS